MIVLYLIVIFEEVKMEYIILSMLLCKSMTVYEIRSYVVKNLSTVCSNSLGSIQTAIKKLLSKGYIEVKEFKENGLTKKEYSITDEGVIGYKGWVGEPINLSKMTNMEESKFFFLGLAPKDKRVSFLKDLIKDLEEQHKRLLAIQETALGLKNETINSNVSSISKDPRFVTNILEVSGEKDLSAALGNTYDYQMSLLRYGIERTKFDISFYKSVLKEEKAR